MKNVYETFDLNSFENSLARPTSWMARTPFRNVATFLVNKNKESSQLKPFWLVCLW